MRLLVGRALVFLALISAVPGPAAAADCPHTPPPGSGERKAIMDALRKPVMAELKQRVVFVVDTLKVCRGQAFIEARPQQPSGQPLAWESTPSPYREAVRNDMCGGYVHALLERRGGGWRVKTHVICATDVPWVSWAEQYGAPPEIFPSLQ